MGVVWYVVPVVTLVAYFLYRGWRYEERLTGISTWAIAREVSRDRGPAEPAPDGVPCRECGTSNDPEVRFCRQCLSSLPDR